MNLWRYRLYTFGRIYQRIMQHLTKERQVNDLPLSDFQRLKHEIRPCDVVLVEGTSHIAEVIKVITQSRWSHAALYIGRLHDIEDPVLRQKIKSVYDGQPDEQLIIESQLGMGTVIRPLHVYDQRHLRICRPHELNFKDAQKVIEYALSRLGSRYDLRAIMDLARFYYPWHLFPKRWRSSLFEWRPGKHVKTVCSTMISEAFGTIHYPILPLVKKVDNGRVRLFQRNPKLNTPSDFDYSPYFDIIKYPFLSFKSGSTEPRYHELPWEGEEGLTEEEALYYIDNIKLRNTASDRIEDSEASS